MEPCNIVIENTEEDGLSDAEVVRNLRKEVKEMKELMKAMKEEKKPVYKIKHIAPKKLTGEKGDVEYKQWAQEFKLYTTQIHPKMKKILTWAEDCKPDEITEDRFNTQ